MSVKKGVGLAVTVLVVGILVANLLPIGISEMNRDTANTSVTQDENETFTIVENVEANTTNISQTNDDVKFVINDTDSVSSQTFTVDNQSSNTFTLNGETFTVTVDNVVDDTTAEVSYEYPREYGWSSAEKNLWGIIPIFIVLAILLWVVRYAKT